MNTTRRILWFCAWLLSVEAALAGVGESRHNLSVSSAKVSIPGAGNEVCIFCHTPHSAVSQQPLWNRDDSKVVYTPYQSTTAKANIGQPTGASRLCLSCHDGTVALASMRSRPGQSAMRVPSATIGPGPNNLGTDLSDDHPISFKYDAALVAANGGLRPPPKSGQVHLDANGEVQCTSCHDPHMSQNDKFLVMNNTASALCVTCHNIKDWTQSSHSLSSKTWNGGTPNPWPHTKETSVMGNGCENCHDPHGAGGKQRLLNYQAEEENCFPCHNGNVAAKNVQAEFSKSSIHPVIQTLGIHDPMESTLLPNASRHVECADCHNPHASKPVGATTAGGVSGALSGVRGVSAAGANVSRITYEYELCFRCHGDTAKGPARVNRQYPQLNTRLEFQNTTATNSFHPVVTVGRNPNVPSLKPPWTTASTITCGDCHNSDSAQNPGGNGVRGPHGSSFPPLLERQLSLADAGANTANSALCFKCHNFVNTTWPQHVEHMGLTACTTCHDPHGSPNAHLINFDPGIVTGARLYQSRGLNHGNCTLSCHGKVHNSTY